MDDEPFECCDRVWIAGWSAGDEAVLVDAMAATPVEREAALTPDDALDWLRCARTVPSGVVRDGLRFGTAILIVRGAAHARRSRPDPASTALSDADAGAAAPGAPRVPASARRKTPTTTWFEVEVVDRAGVPIDAIDVTFTQGAIQTTATTDAQGIARWTGVPPAATSARFANVDAVRERLRARAIDAPTDESPTAILLGETALRVPLTAEQRETIAVTLPLTRIRLVGMHFDTDKAFMRETAVPGIRKVVALYASNPTGQLLVVGHTDTTGSEPYNLELSLERAESVKAYLADDVPVWEAWFADDRPVQKRWGHVEIDHMISALPCEQHVVGFQLWSNATRGTSLAVDGIAGPQTRRALIEAYMALDGTTLPSAIEVVAHGCGEFFPVDDLGDAVEDADNRRVELFCFDDVIQPPVPGPTATKHEPEYDAWVAGCTTTIDIEAGSVVSAHVHTVRLTDFDKQPLPAARCRVAGVVGVVHVADADGFVQLPLPPGTSLFEAQWEPADLDAAAEVPRFYLRQSILVAPVGAIAGLAASDPDCARRLRNLGFEGASMPDLTRDYQRFFGRDPTGELDDIRDELIAWHDGGTRPPMASN